MTRRGRPSKYNDDNEGARVRMARLRAQRKNPPLLQHGFENTFLTSDCRLVQAPVEPAWSAFDDLQGALDAIPLDREESQAQNTGDPSIPEDVPVPLAEPGVWFPVFFSDSPLTPDRPR